MFSLKNIVGDWRSTLLGILIAGSTAVVTYLSQNASTPEVITWVGIGKAFVEAVIFALSNLFNPFVKED
jgi:hypothetical protein